MKKTEVLKSKINKKVLSKSGIKIISPRRQVRKYLGTSKGNEQNKGHTSIDSKDALHKKQIYPYVVALVPAYNEEKRISKSLDSLLNQSRPPDEIIVIADNCTDKTAKISLAKGVNVVQTINNTYMKAGALNQILYNILPMLDPTDTILVMDADTILSPHFIRSALNVLFKPKQKNRKSIGGVGGIFLATLERWTIAGQLQINEYIRYQRRLSRRRGRALVLTGTATMFNIRTLRAVLRGRKKGLFPNKGKNSSVYDTESLTEDNELTLCAKTLNFRVISPKECTVETAIMPTFRSLYKQRIRWQRGALENIYTHGINSHTFPYLLRQIISYLGVGFVILYVSAISTALLRNEDLPWNKPIWLTVAIIYIFEQTFSVRSGGWKSILSSLLIIPELIYNIFLDFIYVICFIDFLFGKSESWGRMRDQNVKINNEERRKSNTRKIDIRTTFHGRIVEIILLCSLLIISTIVFTIPFRNSTLSWQLLAIYVLIGSAATIARLIPVKTS